MEQLHARLSSEYGGETMELGLQWREPGRRGEDGPEARDRIMRHAWGRNAP
jgi:hypothetical protein